jgi:hypothetical protein
LQLGEEWMSFRREEDGNGCSFIYDAGLAPYRDGQTKPRRAQLDTDAHAWLEPLYA